MRAIANAVDFRGRKTRLDDQDSLWRALRKGTHRVEGVSSTGMHKIPPHVVAVRTWNGALTNAVMYGMMSSEEQADQRRAGETAGAFSQMVWRRAIQRLHDHRPSSPLYAVRLDDSRATTKQTTTSRRSERGTDASESGNRKRDGYDEKEKDMASDLNVMAPKGAGGDNLKANKNAGNVVDSIESIKENSEETRITAGTTGSDGTDGTDGSGGVENPDVAGDGATRVCDASLPPSARGASKRSPPGRARGAACDAHLAAAQGRPSPTTQEDPRLRRPRRHGRRAGHAGARGHEPLGTDRIARLFGSDHARVTQAEELGGPHVRSARRSGERQKERPDEADETARSEPHTGTASNSEASKAAFEAWVVMLCSFHAMHGHWMPSSQEWKDLHHFCKTARQARRHPEERLVPLDKAETLLVSLDKDRIAMLDAIGFDWNSSEQHCPKEMRTRPDGCGDLDFICETSRPDFPDADTASTMAGPVPNADEVGVVASTIAAPATSEREVSTVGSTRGSNYNFSDGSSNSNNVDNATLTNDTTAGNVKARQEGGKGGRAEPGSKDSAWRSAHEKKATPMQHESSVKDRKVENLDVTSPKVFIAIGDKEEEPPIGCDTSAKPGTADANRDGKEGSQRHSATSPSITESPSSAKHCCPLLPGEATAEDAEKNSLEDERHEEERSAPSNQTATLWPKKNREVPCPQCGQLFRSRDGLRYHLEKNVCINAMKKKKEKASLSALELKAKKRKREKALRKSNAKLDLDSVCSGRS